MMELIEYTVYPMAYQEQGAKFTSDCNSIQLINEGLRPLIINGVITVNPQSSGTTNKLYFDNSLKIEGNLFEIDRTQYDVRFSPDDIVDGTAKLVVIRKIYKDPKKAAEILSKMLK